jgi:hypothetical protein
VNAWPHAGRGGGVLTAALARAEAWLLEPLAPGAPAPPVEPPPRPVVAVRGLARGCGASTVARALAATLARDDPTGASVLVGGPTGTGPRIAAPAALRLARTLADGGFESVRASGRVCLVGDTDMLVAVPGAYACPLVIDVAHASPPAEGLGSADLAVLVASPAVEPALAGAVETSLAAAGHRVELVMNRVEPIDPGPRPDPPFGGQAIGEPLAIAESRLAAQLALACREARGPFARPIAELADRGRAAARG